MVITKDVWLPSAAELESPEIKMTTLPLMAAAHHLGKYCDLQCKEFMLCHQESMKDPRRCLAEGREVTSCGLDFFRRVKSHCALEFEKYLNCFEKRSGGWNWPHHCRRDQLPLDDCIKRNLGQDRPPVGYFSKVRLHHSDRPRFGVQPAPMPRRIEELDLEAAPLPDSAFAFGRLDAGDDTQERARRWLRAEAERTTARDFLPPADA